MKSLLLASLVLASTLSHAQVAETNGPGNLTPSGSLETLQSLYKRGAITSIEINEDTSFEPSSVGVSFGMPRISRHECRGYVKGASNEIKLQKGEVLNIMITKKDSGPQIVFIDHPSINKITCLTSWPTVVKKCQVNINRHMNEQFHVNSRLECLRQFGKYIEFKGSYQTELDWDANLTEILDSKAFKVLEN